VNDKELILADQFKDNVIAKNWDRALGTLETLKKYGLKLYCTLFIASYFAEKESKNFWIDYLPPSDHSEHKECSIDRVMHTIRIKDIEQKRAKDKEGQLERDFVRALQSEDWKAALNLSDLAQSLNHDLRVRKIDALKMYSAATQDEICAGVLRTADMDEFITINAHLAKKCLEEAMRQSEQGKQQSAARAI